MTGRSAQSGKRARYPAYAPSDVEWLGEVPERWPTVRLRFRTKINPSRSEINGCPGSLDVSFVPMESVHEYGGILLDQTRPLAEVATGYTYFRDGDVVIAKITPCFENGKGSIAQDLVNGIGFGTTELHVLRPFSDLNRRFLFYVTISHAFRCLGTAEMYGAGGQKRVPENFVKDFRQPIPPIKEQEIITVFLDREIARIDALIEKKQRQIELLQEKRSALISHAVTKGLDPNVRMKDSGIEWLGEIPGHWRIKRLRFVSILQTGVTLGKKYEDRQLVSRPYIRVANVQDGYLDLETVTNIEIPPEDAERYELQHGDVLMTEGGDFDKLGRGYVWENQIPGCLHQNHIFAVRPNKRELSPHFLAAVLTSSHGKNYFTSTSQQTTNLATTNSTKLRSFPVPLPPFDEQAMILEQLQHVTNQLDGLIIKVNFSMDKLREYRTALISAAVTGKIDVRKEAHNAC
jgi:type I restriction enzyme S subunit